MATTATLAHVDWLARVWAPARLTDMGLTDLAASAAGMQTISNVQRLNGAFNWISSQEAALWAQYTPAWDQWWSAGLEQEWASFIADAPPDILAAILADPNLTVRAALKGALRLIELFRCRDLAGL